MDETGAAGGGRGPSHDTNQEIYADPSRRTWLAQERTLLAWWRTALGTMAVAVAIGSILPKLAQLPEAPFVALGAGYATLSLWFILLGGYRHLTGEKALAQRRYLGLSRVMVIALTVYLMALLAATVWVMYLGPDS